MGTAGSHGFFFRVRTDGFMILKIFVCSMYGRLLLRRKSADVLQQIRLMDRRGRIKGEIPMTEYADMSSGFVYHR